MQEEGQGGGGGAALEHRPDSTLGPKEMGWGNTRGAGATITTTSPLFQRGLSEGKLMGVERSWDRGMPRPSIPSLYL